jgi:hypothetical protein
VTLPVPPVVTGADIAAWLDITAPTEEADPDQLVELAAAVDLIVRGLPSTVKLFDLTPAPDPHEWDARWTRGAKMWAGRLHRRRLSPEGVYAIATDAVAYVTRNDPDVAALLRLNLPMVG